MARQFALAAVLAVLALAFPALAHAVTYCVNASGCTGVNEPDLQTALNAAQGTTSVADTVQVGDPGPPPGVGWEYTDGGHTANQVDIVGAGPANTVLSAPASSEMLSVIGAGSAISDLTVQLPNASGIGLATTGSLSNVDVTTLDDGSHPQTAAGLEGTSAEHWTGGQITLPTTVGHIGILRAPGTPATVDLADLTITAGTGLGPTAGDDMTVRRSSITSVIGAVNNGAHLTLDNVVFHQVAKPSPPPVPVMITQPSGSDDATSDLNHVTAFGTGVNGGLAFQALDAAGLSSTMNVRNSIVRNFFTTIDREASNSGGSANVNLSYSDVDLLHTTSTNSSGATGAITAGAGMLDTDPLLTNPTAGNFSLKPGSPAIDAGDPAGLLPGDSTTDVLGAPRISNGRQDMGAVEFQAAPPTPPTQPAPPPAPPAKDRLAPKLTLSKLPSRLTLKRLLKGIKFTVTTSEPSAINATLAGSASSVKLAKSFNLTLAQKKLGLAAGARHITLKVRKKILGHSRRFTLRLTVAATDASGNVSTIRRSIRVQ